MVGSSAVLISSCFDEGFLGMVVGVGIRGCCLGCDGRDWRMTMVIVV